MQAVSQQTTAVAHELDRHFQRSAAVNTQCDRDSFRPSTQSCLWVDSLYKVVNPTVRSEQKRYSR